MVPFWVVIAHSQAVGQDKDTVRRCLSIANIDERVDCLESGGANLDSSQSQKSSTTARAGPSFDCRAASQSIERAICADVVLSELDARMGQQFLQARRSRKPSDAQILLDGQRSWIQRRNSTCGAVAGAAVWSCITEMTKQRTAELAATQQTAEASVSAPLSPRPPPQLVSREQSGVTVPAATPSASANASKAAPTANEPASQAPSSLLVVLFIVGAIVGGIAIFNSIQKRQRLIEENARLAAERQRLVAKYGEEIAERILGHLIWQGMTEDQLIESWGAPADRDHEVKHTKTKQTLKYGQTGRNRFKSRVFIENGHVIGWKQ
ncbi:lysozyme inhibitor LprI family protein [Tardiphaga sp. 71_E8_N1_1]|uniref:lysozyme inhibitor LprI family protein n=1 Tax=Tardiphaga sp. 71_E8_N1_1 TaxID=3240784 RepID=UPI003F8B2078